MAPDHEPESNTGKLGNGGAAAAERPAVAAGPYIRGALAAVSIGAAVIHFSVMFEHFAEYWAYGTFFLVTGWAQAIWAPLVYRRASRWLLWAGAIGNALIVVTYIVTRTAGDVIGPGASEAEEVGGVDVVCTVFEAAIVVGCLLLLLRRSGTEDRRVPARSARYVLAGSVGAVLVATIAVSTPALAGPEGPAGMAGDMDSASSSMSMSMSGSTAAPTADQIDTVATLLAQTRTSLARFQRVQAALSSGYSQQMVRGDLEYVFSTSGGFVDLNPQRPSALIYAVNVPGHAAPVLLGAMFIAPPGATGMVQVGGSLMPWETRGLDCASGQVTIDGYGVPFYGEKCSSATWNPDRFTVQMLHVWTVPVPGGPFSTSVSQTAIRTAAQDALAVG